MLGTRATRAQNPPDSRNGTPVGGQKTLLSWLEPPVQAKPTFAEAGLARGGVFEGMLPLGTLPKTAKKHSSSAAHPASARGQAQLLPSAMPEVSGEESTAAEEDEVMVEPATVPARSESAEKTAPVEVSTPVLKPVDVAAVSPAPSQPTPRPRIIFRSRDALSTRSTPAPRSGDDKARGVTDNLTVSGDTKLGLDTRSRSTRASSARAAENTTHSDAADSSPRRQSRSSRHTSATPVPAASVLINRRRNPPRASSVASGRVLADKPDEDANVDADDATETDVDVTLVDDALRREAAEVVEIAVQEAVDHLRYPTAWAIRTLFDERRKDTSFLSTLVSLYRQTADERTLKDFLLLLTDKKREGKKANRAKNIFSPDKAENDEHALRPKPAPFADLVKLDLSVYASATGDEERSNKRRKITRTSDSPRPATTIIISPSADRATKTKTDPKEELASSQLLTTPSRRKSRRSRSRSGAKMSETSSLSSARSLSPITKGEDNSDRDESLLPDIDSPTPRVNGGSMGQALGGVFGDAGQRRGNSNHGLGDEGEEDGVIGGRAAGAGLPSAAPQPMAARRTPANNHGPETDATKQGGNVSPAAQIPGPSSAVAATSKPSPETLTIHTHTHTLSQQPNGTTTTENTRRTRSSRSAASRAQTPSSSVAPATQTAPGAQSMPSAVDAPSVVLFPKLASKLAASRQQQEERQLDGDVSEVTEIPVFKSKFGAPHGTEKTSQFRLRAKGVTNGHPGLDSSVRPSAESIIAIGGSEAAGAPLDGTRSRPSSLPSLSGPNEGRATRSKRRAPDDEDDTASPTVLSFPPFPDGFSGPASRDGTPVPGRAAKRQKTGLRVKSS
jgi:hypothetical protein